MPSAADRLKAVFDLAAEVPHPAARAAFLDRECAGDPALRERVEALLRAHDAAGSFLARPPAADPDKASGHPPGADSTAAWSGPPPESGAVLAGRYKLLEEIGEGGMGTVWMAEQTEPVKRRVALKLVKPGMDSKQVLARFEAERQALALMDHPNIAKVLDGGITEGGRPFFVMELVKGVPITRYADDHKMPVRDRLRLFADVCRAVQHAHQKGVIHRDLKPNNVLVAPYDGRPVVKVIDFGVAKATGSVLTERTMFTAFGAIVGTPEYMSPEQAEVNNQDVDTRSDVYALGVLLYELLTGTTPLTRQRVKDAALVEVLRLVREEDPPRPSTRLSGTDELPSIAAVRGIEPKGLCGLLRGELDWIVMRALEKDRNRRYETANGFAADVQRYLNDETVQACPPSAGYLLRKFARRNKTGLTFAGLVFFFLVLVGSGIGWVVGDRAARRAKAAGSVEDALAQARDFMKDEKWPEAKAASQRANGLLTGAGGNDSLHQRLKQLEVDLDMVARLESARLHRASLDWRFDEVSANSLYEDVFRVYGIPVSELDPEEAARRISASAIREQILAALVDWASILTNPAEKKKLTAILRLANDDPWRQQVFNALDAQDWPRLARMASQPEALEQQPSRIVALGKILARIDLPNGVAFLRKAQRRHRDDFWLNEVLAIELTELGPEHLEESLRYSMAAMALRPLSTVVRYNFGFTLQEMGRLDEAIAEYREVIRLKPDYAEPHGNLGVVLEKKGQLDEAIAEYRVVVGLKKDSGLAHSNLANALRDKGHTDEAIAEYREAIRLSFAGAHINLGLLLRAKGQLDEAIAEFREAIRLGQHTLLANSNLGYVSRFDVQDRLKLQSLAHVNLGVALSGKGQLDEAIAEFREAIRLNKDFAGAHYLLGNALDNKKDLEGAIREFRTAIQIEPKNAPAHNNLGNALHDKKDLDGAIQEFRAAIRIDPNFAGAHYNLGNALSSKKDLDGAIQEFRTAIRIDPKNCDAYFNLGNALHDKKDLDGAIQEFTAAIRIDSNRSEFHNNLAKSLIAKNDLDGAVEEFREAFRIAPDDALIRKNLTWALNQQAWRLATGLDPKSRDPRRAQRLAKEAVQLMPQEGAYWRTLAALSFRAGDSKTANESLKNSTELGKGDNHADQFLLAIAHWHQGEKKVALECFDRADQWMRQKHPSVAELCHLQAEAAIVLGLAPPWSGHYFAGHRGSVNCAVFDPRGRWLASSGQDKLVRLWDIANGKEVLSLEGHTREVWGVAFRRDGQRIASAAGDRSLRNLSGEVIVWDSRKGKKILTLAGQKGGFFCVTYSPDGKHLAAAGYDGVIRIWDADSGKEEQTLKGHAGQVCGLAYRPDGKQLASAGFDRSVRLWDAASGKEVFTFKGHGAVVWSVAFSPDGRSIASASDDFTVKIWQPGTDKVLTLEGHTTTPYSVAFSPNGKWLVSASGHRWRPEFPGEVKLWDAATGQPVRTLQRPSSGFFSVAFSPDGKQVAAGSLDFSVTLCDVPAPEK